MASRCRSSKQRIALACMAVALVLPAAGLAATVTTVGTIPRSSDDGAFPTGGLTQLDGVYYGTTSGGGQGTGFGVVYRINVTTGAEKVVYTFTGGSDGNTPAAGLTSFNGKLYGTTVAGGASNFGVVFSIDPATGTETVVASLPSETDPRGRLVAFGGILYGTGYNCGGGYACIFKVDPQTGSYNVAYNLQSDSDGAAPGDLIQHGRYLFGTASAGGKRQAGTLFRFDPATNELRVEHSFGAKGDGAEPTSTLAELDGLLYGTTETGGQSKIGTIFSLNPSGHQEAVVYDFGGSPRVSFPPGGLVNVGGLLYGTAYGGVRNTEVVVFSFHPDPVSPQLQILETYSRAGTDVVSYPFVAAHGRLIGTTTFGGTGLNNSGEIVAIDIATGQFTLLHDFSSEEDSTVSSLIKMGGSLYGLAASGGSNSRGSIFRATPSAGTVETVHSFQGLDGADPVGGLLDVSGVLFGTTVYGGAHDLGTLFSFDPSNRKLTTLHEFDDTDGQHPQASLTAVNGVAYGTTLSGSKSHRFGAVFSLNTTDFHESIVADFTNATGYSASPMTLVDGALYGVGQRGGANDFGTIFKLDPATGKLTALYSFMGGVDGGAPSGPLCLLDGILYGVTVDGPRTVFAFDPSTNVKTILQVEKHFSFGGDGLVAKGKNLFGVAYSSKTAPYGGVFKLDPATGHATLYPFTDGPSIEPNAALVLSNGALFGTTAVETSTTVGTVYKFVP